MLNLPTPAGRALLFSSLVVPTIPTTNLALWLSGRTAQCYADSPPTLLCATSANVRTEKALGTGLSNAAQSTGANQPTTETDGLKFNTTSAYLQIDTPLALTGDFTSYMTGNIAALAQNWIPLGHATTAGVFERYTNNNFYVVTDASVVASRAMAVTGLVLLRVRRASGTIFISFTGTAENAGSALAGTITLNTIGARPYPATTVWNGSTSNRHLSRIVYSRSLTPGGTDDLAVRSYLLAQDGVAL